MKLFWHIIIAALILGCSNQSDDTLGVWSIGYYNGNDSTTNGYITTDIYGIFSNSAVTDSYLKVSIIIDRDGIKMPMYKYAGADPIKGEGTISYVATDSHGNSIQFEAINTDSGDNNLTMPEELKQMLIKGGEIRFTATSHTDQTPNVYRFTLKSGDHLERALKEL